MAAARAFLGERKDELPVAVIAYNPEITRPHRLHDGQGAARRRRSPKAPETAEGTRIYDALIEAASTREGPGLRADDRRPPLGRAPPSASRPRARRRCRPLQRRERPRHLRRPQLAPVRPRDAPEPGEATRAARTSRARHRASSSRSSQAIGQQLSNEYVVSYRSLLPPNAKAIGPRSRSRASRPRPRSTRRRRSTSRRRARSRRAGSTRSSRRRG